MTKNQYLITLKFDQNSIEILLGLDRAPFTETGKKRLKSFLYFLEFVLNSTKFKILQQPLNSQQIFVKVILIGTQDKKKLYNDPIRDSRTTRWTVI